MNPDTPDVVIFWEFNDLKSSILNLPDSISQNENTMQRHKYKIDEIQIGDGVFLYRRINTTMICTGKLFINYQITVWN